MVLKLFVFHSHHPEKLKRQNLKTQMLISGRNSEIENPSILLTMTRLLIKKKTRCRKISDHKATFLLQTLKYWLSYRTSKGEEKKKPSSTLSLFPPPLPKNAVYPTYLQLSFSIIQAKAETSVWTSQIKVSAVFPNLQLIRAPKSNKTWR